MVSREHSAEFINRIVNSPAVRPFVDYSGGEGPLDLSPAVGRATQTGIVWLSNSVDAVVAFPMTADRDYQAHLFFDASCRGRRALETAREMLAWMRPYADLIWGAIPTRNRAALWFARTLGFAEVRRAQYEAEGEVAIVELRFV